MYSMYGSLNYLLPAARAYGFIPTVLKRDTGINSLSSINLNLYQAISLLNHNSSLINDFTLADQTAILDYLNPGGNYVGGVLVLFPSQNSDLGSINQIVDSYNISYSLLPKKRSRLYWKPTGFFVVILPKKIL